MTISIADIPAAFERAADLQRRGQLAEAEAVYREVLGVWPDLKIALDNLAILLLAQGRYAEGLPLYEGRFGRAGTREAKPQLSFPEWDGGPVGSLLIWGEQGFGDRIQFARYAPALAARGIKMTMLVPPELSVLFMGLGIDLITASGEIEIPRHDAFVMSSSLPHRMGARIDTLPGEAYLRAPSFRLVRPPSTARIGVVTGGDPRHHNDAHRSLPAEAAARLMALSADMISLNPKQTGARDFADTAAIIHGLDLVICVDTSVAHLAGAMGKPVWILLPDHDTDWRWLRGRDDSPWYPTARLFRQPAPGAWGPVIDEVSAALGARTVGTPP